MRKRTNRFLIISFAVIFILCTTVFIFLTAYLNRQNNQTVTQLGNIYMSSMNNRISKHFGTMTEHRLIQMETLVKTIPSSYRSGKEEFGEWLTYNGQARGFDSLAYCKTNGDCNGEGSTKLCQINWDKKTTKTIVRNNFVSFRSDPVELDV